MQEKTCIHVISHLIRTCCPYLVERYLSNKGIQEVEEKGYAYARNWSRYEGTEAGIVRVQWLCEELEQGL